MDDAGRLIFNNKVVLVPLKNSKDETVMSLQVIYDQKMKVKKSQKPTKKDKTTLPANITTVV
jgi:hypothetical protein